MFSRYDVVFLKTKNSGPYVVTDAAELPETLIRLAPVDFAGWGYTDNGEWGYVYNVNGGRPFVTDSSFVHYKEDTPFTLTNFGV